MQILTRLATTIIIDEYTAGCFEWQVLDSEGELQSVGESPSAEVAEECAIAYLKENPPKLCVGVGDCVHSLHGRLENGAELHEAIQWCKDELTSVYSGESPYTDEV